MDARIDAQVQGFVSQLRGAVEAELRASLEDDHGERVVEIAGEEYGFSWRDGSVDFMKEFGVEDGRLVELSENSTEAVRVAVKLTPSVKVANVRAEPF